MKRATKAIWLMGALVLGGCQDDDLRSTDRADLMDSDGGSRDGQDGVLEPDLVHDQELDPWQDSSDGGFGPDGDATDDADAAGDVEPVCTEDTDWWIWDLSVMPPRDAQICAFVRGESEHVVVVVEQSAWGVTVDEEAVQNILAAWEEATPVNPEAGIYELATALFGQPPDTFDQDPRIYLLLYEMEGYRGFSFDGYFRVDDQSDGATSNRHEMLHINTFERQPDSDYMLSVQAHEFQHLIHWQHDRNEESWLNEAMSELAMVITGFSADESWVSSWLAAPLDPLIPDGIAVNYGALLLFGTYLFEQLGPGFILDLVADPANGVASMDGRLDAREFEGDFSELVADFGLAVAVNDPELESGRFGFELVDLDTVRSRSLAAGSPVTVTVSSGAGLAFIRSVEDLTGRTLRIETDNPADLRIRAAVEGTSQTALILDALAGATTEVELAGWASSGAILWVVAANPSSSDRQVTVSLE